LTVSAIWWNRASGVALVGLALVVGGCTPGGVGIAPPSGNPPTPPPAAADKVPAQAGLGLVPLPSPQQVSAAVALGRLDPFTSPRPQAAASMAAAPGSTASGAGGGTAGGASAAAGAAAALKAVPPAIPADFQFSGVITSRGRAEALVQTGSFSGTVQVGDVGKGSANPWLPKGWSVDAIDAGQGVLTLRQGLSTRRFNLL